MDAIRKKMQSLKGETDSLYATIQKFEDATKESNRLADQVVIRQIRRYLKNDLSRPIVTFVTLERKFMLLRLILTRPMISFKKLQSLWRKRRSSSRK